ncbi:hypothetical protein ACTMU2_16950 [Cupriavidus basilensis]
MPSGISSIAYLGASALHPQPQRPEPSRHGEARNQPGGRQGGRGIAVLTTILAGSLDGGTTIIGAMVLGAGAGGEVTGAWK